MRFGALLLLFVSMVMGRPPSIQSAEPPVARSPDTQDTSLKTRLVALERRYVVGQPMRFRLELVNAGATPAGIPLSQGEITILNSTFVSMLDGTELPSIFYGGYQTLAGAGPPTRTLQPGEAVELVSEIDVSVKHWIVEPGEYRVQFRCNDYDCDDVPASEPIVIRVEPGELSDLQRALASIRRVKPKHWVVYRAEEGKVKPIGRSEVMGFTIAIGRPMSIPPESMRLWITKDIAGLAIPTLPASAEVSEDLRMTSYGRAYLSLGEGTPGVWQKAKSDILQVLNDRE